MKFVFRLRAKNKKNKKLVSGNVGESQINDLKNVLWKLFNESKRVRGY